MNKEFFKTLFNNLVIKRIGKIFMYKTPFFATVVVVLIAIYGCNYFSAKPPLVLVPVQTAAVHRIAEKAQTNKLALSELDAKWNKLYVALNEGRLEESKNLISEVNNIIKKYKISRDDTVKKLMEYLYLNLEEYENIFKLNYGNLPGDAQKLLDDAKTIIKKYKK